MQSSDDGSGKVRQMESMADILNRMTKEAISRNTSNSGGNHLPENEPEDRCPICDGLGWVERRVPLGHPDFGELFPCRCREQAADHERHQRLQRYSGLPKEMLERMTFETFNVRRLGIHLDGQDSLKRAHYVASTFAMHPKGWLLINGPPGSGKTHLAVAVVERCIKNGHPALFTFVPDLLDHLRAAFSQNSPMNYSQLFEQIKSVPMLILDGLGAESSTSWSKEKLLQIIVHRHNARLPTIITTHLKMQEMRGSHPRLVSRFLDVDVVEWIAIETPDYRDHAGSQNPSGGQGT